jgi:hypothetical protein
MNMGFLRKRGCCTRQFGFAIWNFKICKTLFFILREKNRFTKRIFLFTSEDDPHRGELEKRQLALSHSR